MSDLKLGRAVLGAMALALAMPAPMASAADTTVMLTEADFKAASLLCTDIRNAVTRVPTTGTVEDVEAAIMFTISQSRQTRPVIGEALRCVAGWSRGNRVQQAMANVFRGYGVGTGSIGALGNFGGFGNTGTFLSTPVVGIGGGGGSNYTPSN